MRLGFALPAPLLLTLASCASAPSATPPAEAPRLFEPTEHPPAPDFADAPRDLKRLATIVPRWSVNDGGPAALFPEVTVLLAREAGALRGLDNSNGKLRWSRDLTPAPGAAPVRVGALVVVAAQDGLHAFDSATGAPRWHRPGVFDALLAGETQLFALRTPLAAAPEVTAHDPKTGAVIWARPCRPGCRLTGAQQDRLLVAPTPERRLVVEGGRITLVAAGLRNLRSDQLLAEGLLVATSTAVTLRDVRGARFSVALPGVRSARRAGDVVLVDIGTTLLGLDPLSGAERWRIRLSEDLQSKLRLDRVAYFPEGQFLVPTEDLFGAAPLYLLVRDDGTLRIVRYGHPGLRAVHTDGPLALFSADSGLVLSGTRRRGAPLRHYETPAQDVAGQLERLSVPARTQADRAMWLKTRTWLYRLGRPVYAQALHAKIAAAAPEALAGLLFVLDPSHPEDAQVALQATTRLSVAPSSPNVDLARQEALRLLPQPWPDPLWRRLLADAPDWLTGVPQLGWSASARTPTPWTSAAPAKAPWGTAQVAAQAAREAISTLTAAAPAAGYTEALWARLEPAVAARRATFPCPWPEALAEDRWPVPSRCPLDAPPLGAVLSADASVAVWRAGAAGDRDDVWVMQRDGAAWGAARFTGLRFEGALTVDGTSKGAAVLGDAKVALPTPRALAADRDRDGLPDRLEARLGTQPRRSDTDGDGLPDAEDPSPSCPRGPRADPRDQLRHAVAGTVAALDPGPGPWLDTSARCLSLTMSSGPLLRAAQDGLPRANRLAADVLEGEALAAALETATRAGQLQGPLTAPETTAIRWHVTRADGSMDGATWVYALRAGRWRRVAVLDVRRSTAPVRP